MGLRCCLIHCSVVRTKAGGGGRAVGKRFRCGVQATKVRGLGQSRKVLAMESFYTMPQYEAWKEAKPPGTWDVKYYKVRAALRLPWTRVSVALFSVLLHRYIHMYAAYAHDHRQVEWVMTRV